MSIAAAAPAHAELARTTHAFAVDEGGTTIDDVVPLDGTPGHVCVVGECASGKTTTVRTLVENRLLTTDGHGEPLTQVLLCAPLGLDEYGDLPERVALFAGDHGSIHGMLDWLEWEMGRRSALRARLGTPVLPTTRETPHLVLAVDDFTKASVQGLVPQAALGGVVAASRRLNASVIVACDNLSRQATGGERSRDLLRGGRAVLLRNLAHPLAPSVFGGDVGDCWSLPHVVADGSSASASAFLVGFPYPANRAVRVLRVGDVATTDPAPGDGRSGA